MPEQNENQSGLKVPEGSPSGLGAFLDRQLDAGRIKFWRTLFFLILLAVALLNLLIKSHHPHFGVDRYPFFWPVFGLVIGGVMVVLVKKIIQPVIKKPEDFYGDL
ncbi:MAG: hypothetical protein LBR53_00165 [Deltaproteobacteria bacterium]|jgi:hypothetical protein|nr:hypothetical protein [Deltaproteobacteria bacterium]